MKYLKQHAGRFELMHLKDMATGTATGRQVGKAPKETSVAMGEGKLDWKAILAAAKQSGVRLYYIEDESPAAPDQMPETLRYLRRAGF